MKARLLAMWAALHAMGRQFLLWLDQGGNVLLPGLGAVVTAGITGKVQNVAYADETMSAHAWRAYDRGRLWGLLLLPLIELLFIWQGQDEEVNKRAGKAVTGHCERAFWKELMHREMPPAYRDAKYQTRFNTEET